MFARLAKEQPCPLGKHLVDKRKLRADRAEVVVANTLRPKRGRRRRFDGDDRTRIHVDSVASASAGRGEAPRIEKRLLFAKDLSLRAAVWAGMHGAMR